MDESQVVEMCVRSLLPHASVRPSLGPGAGGGSHAGSGPPLGAVALSRPCSMAHARWPVSRGTPTPQLPLPSQFLICDKKPALLLVSQLLICDKKLAKNASCSFYNL